MPKKKTTVTALPQAWLDAVIPLLEDGDVGRIHWTARARRDMAAVGLTFNISDEEWRLDRRLVRERVIGMAKAMPSSAAGVAAAIAGEGERRVGILPALTKEISQRAEICLRVFEKF